MSLLVLRFKNVAVDQFSWGGSIDRAVDTDTFLVPFSHWDDWQHIAIVHGFVDAIGVVPTVGRRDARLWWIACHKQIEAEIVGCLAGRVPVLMGKRVH